MGIYFDNAATSFPKPSVVLDAMVKYQQECGASPGRGAYQHAHDATKILDRCRVLLCELVHAPSPRHCIFTLNCTDALNLAISGIATHHRRRHEEVHIVTTAMDHNSVLRPLSALECQGCTHTIVAADSQTGLVHPTDIAKALTKHTRLVVVAHGSNVTGTVQDIAAISNEIGDVPLLIDASQTMGHTPIDMQTIGIDLIAFPGHKGLLGPLGTGGLIMLPHMAPRLDAIRFGGTGSESDLPTQPTKVPDKYESGSHNMIGICGLAAAVQWILSKGVDALHNHEISLCNQFIEELKPVPDVRIVGPQTSEHRCGVFSLVCEGSPEKLARFLEESHGIQCRWGLHCAPYAHATMKSDTYGGTVRVSFGPFHTSKDISNLVDAVVQCTQQVYV